MKLTRENFMAVKKSLPQPGKNWIKVGMSTCGLAAGAGDVYKILQQEKEKRKLSIKIEKCGCEGRCHAEPLVEVAIEGLPQVMYGKVDQDTARQIIEKHVLGRRLVNDHIYEVRGGVK